MGTRFSFSFSCIQMCRLYRELVLAGNNGRQQLGGQPRSG